MNESATYLPGSFPHLNFRRNLPRAATSQWALEPLEPRALLSAAFTIANLGTLGGQASVAHAINNRGDVVGESDTLTASNAFLYKSGRMINVDADVNQNGTLALAINDRGQVAGAAFFQTRPIAPVQDTAFVYKSGKRSQIDGAYATGLNNSGLVVGWTDTLVNQNVGYPITGSSAAIFHNRKPQDLGLGEGSQARGVNDAGQVVGTGSIQGNSLHAFLYQNGKTSDLGTLGGDQSAAEAINKTGEIVGEADTPLKDSQGNARSHAYVVVDGKMTDVGTSFAGNSQAEAVNASGQVVGYFEAGTRADGSVNQRAFLYSSGKMYDLNALLGTDSGWTISDASGINDKGQIAATGTDVLGRQRALLLDPIPGVSVDQAGGKANVAAADLAVTLVSTKFASPILAGKGSLITVELTNSGVVRASGTVTINLYSSSSESTADGERMLTTTRRIKLAPGASEQFSFKAHLPQDLVAGDYRILAEVVAPASMTVMNPSNDVGTTAAPITVAERAANLSVAFTRPVAALSFTKQTVVSLTLTNHAEYNRLRHGGLRDGRIS